MSHGIALEVCLMSSLLRDVRHSVRTLRQSPGFTAVAVLTLAIGIGANTAIFSFVDAMLLKPLPYPDADRIVRVMEKPPRGERNGISTLNFLDWQRDNTVFDFMSAQTGRRGHADRWLRTRPAQRRPGVCGLLQGVWRRTGTGPDVSSR